MFLSWCKFAALFLSDFRPVHPGSDYADLSCWLRWHMRRTWTEVDIIQMLDHSSLKLLPLKRIVCPCRYCMVKNTKNSWVFTFSASVFISATEMELQQTRSFTEKLWSLESSHWFWKPGLMFSVMSHVRTGKCHCNIFQTSQPMPLSNLMSRKKSLCCIDMMVFNLHCVSSNEIKQNRIFLWLCVYPEGLIYDTASGVSSSASSCCTAGESSEVFGLKSVFHLVSV